MNWINLLLGVWLILAPFVLGYSDTNKALWSDLIVGVVIVILAIATLAGGKKGSTPASQ